MLSRRERRGAHSKTSCTCGKHGGCCKVYACGCRSTSAFANVNKARGWGSGRMQAPRLKVKEVADDAKRDDPPSFFLCGCDWCWAQYYSAGDERIPEAHRYEPTTTYDHDEASACYECETCDDDESNEEPSPEAELASTRGSESVEDETWEVVSDTNGDSDSAWEFVGRWEKDDCASIHSCGSGVEGSWGGRLTYAQAVVASL